MRVAVDVTPLGGPRTGIGHFTAELLAALDAFATGVTVVPFALSARALLQPDTRARLPFGTRFLPIPARIAHRLWAVSDIPRFDRHLDHAPVVHATNFVAPPVRAARVVSIHDLTFLRRPELCRPEVLRMVPAVRRAVARGAWVHTLTDAIGAQVRADLGTDRVVTVHPAATPLPSGGVVSAVVAAIVAGPPFVLAIGAAEPRKNLTALVRAWATAEQAGDLSLVIAGPPGPDTPMLTALARGSHAVTLTGYVDNADRTALLAGARVLVHPAIDEGFGIPVVEAMEMGVPAVCSDTPVLREVAGDAARFVSRWDSGAIATVHQLAADDTARAALIAAGRQRAARYSWERTAHGMAALYLLAAESK